MRFYAEDKIDKQDQELFWKIRQVIIEMPDPDTAMLSGGRTNQLTCHMLADAIRRVFPLGLVRGWRTKPGSTHSWLVTFNHNIIDVYPVGTIGGPILISRFAIDFRKDYIPDNSIPDLFDDQDWYQCTVRGIVSIISNQLMIIDGQTAAACYSFSNRRFK